MAFNTAQGIVNDAVRYFLILDDFSRYYTSGVLQLTY